MNIFIKKFLFPIIIFSFISLFAIYFITDNSLNDTKTNYTLKSYKNTVALYNGENVVDVYDQIVLNTLPTKDVQTFKQGINFDTKEQAETYLENFDG